jgi:hypothetical protein
MFRVFVPAELPDAVSDFSKDDRRYYDAVFIDAVWMPKLWIAHLKGRSRKVILFRLTPAA